MKIESLNLAEIKLDKQNARKHDDRSIEAIGKSLEAFGQQKPVVVTSKNVVVAGNGTVQAAKSLGWKSISAVRLPGDWTQKQIQAYAIADNRTADLSEWNVENLLKQIQSFDPEKLGEVGFSEDEIQDLLEFQVNPFVTVRENVSDLKPHPRNYQRHPQDQLDQIIASIETHGFYRNIVVAQDNTILAGHGVVEAVKKMGRKRVPVIRLPLDPDEPRALKVLTSDNEINNLAEVDDRGLTEMLKEIMSEDGLAGTGFSEQQLAALTMVTRPASEIKDINEAAEWIGLPEFIPEENPIQVIVAFRNTYDRDEFAKRLDLELRDKQRQSIWFPDKERRDLDSVRWSEDD